VVRGERIEHLDLVDKREGTRSGLSKWRLADGSLLTEEIRFGSSAHVRPELSSGADGQDKQSALETAAKMFERARAEYQRLFIEGLSDPSPDERAATARLLTSEVMPALDGDTNPESRALTLKTLSVLAAEVRAPQSLHERQDFDNAMFHFTRRKLLSRK